jgi:HK97 family phage major capsid protein
MATTTTASPILRPEDVDSLLILPTLAASVAAQVCRVVRTSSTTFRIPRVTDDPDAAWVAEGAEIPVSDVALDEVAVTPSKVAGLTIITNELAADSSPEAAEVVGDGLARDIARRVDQAFAGNLAAPAPKGLASLTGVTAVAAPSTWANLDPFAEAVARAEGVGANVGAWLAHPDDALALSLLRTTTSGSNETLLQADPTQPARRVLQGRPLLVSANVAVGDVYGVPEDRCVMVVREDADVVADGSPFFTSDRTAVRATMRVGFGFPHEAAVVRIRRAAPTV